jgi:hypothetical protein
MPQEIAAFCNSWFVTDSNQDLWACETLAEVLDMLKESELKKLMPRRNEQLGPVAIMNPAVQLVTGQAAEGTGAAAGAPDNPEPLGINCIPQLMRREDLVDPDD